MRNISLVLAFCISLISGALAQGGMQPGPGTVHSTGSSCTTVYDKTSVMTTTDSAQGTLSYRFVIPAAQLSAATGTKVRLTATFPSGNTGSIGNTFFGAYTGTPVNMGTSQVRVTWSASNSLSAAGAGSFVSDIVTLGAGASFSNANPYMIAIDLTATVSAAENNAVTGDVFYYNTSAASSATSPDNGSVADLAYLFTKIEICT